MARQVMGIVTCGPGLPRAFKWKRGRKFTSPSTGINEPKRWIATVAEFMFIGQNAIRAPAWTPAAA